MNNLAFAEENTERSWAVPSHCFYSIQATLLFYIQLSAF